jgi:hypothetical protein
MRIAGVTLDDAIPEVRAVFVGPTAEAALCRLGGRDAPRAVGI